MFIFPCNHVFDHKSNPDVFPDWQGDFTFDCFYAQFLVLQKIKKNCVTRRSEASGWWALWSCPHRGKHPQRKGHHLGNSSPESEAVGVTFASRINSSRMPCLCLEKLLWPAWKKTHYLTSCVSSHCHPEFRMHISRKGFSAFKGNNFHVRIISTVQETKTYSNPGYSGK